MQGRGSESHRHAGLGYLVLVPTKETLMCCQKSGKMEPELRKQGWDLPLFPGRTAGAQVHSQACPTRFSGDGTS